MAQENENLMLEILKMVQTEMSGFKYGMVDLKHRVSMIERNTADIALSFVSEPTRIDRLEKRLDRIERRLGWSSH